MSRRRTGILWTSFERRAVIWLITQSVVLLTFPRKIPGRDRLGHQGARKEGTEASGGWPIPTCVPIELSTVAVGSDLRVTIHLLVFLPLSWR